VEEQRAARGAERQVAQFVQDHEVELGKAFGKLPMTCSPLSPRYSVSSVQGLVHS
jgi:hypothetical protein